MTTAVKEDASKVVPQNPTSLAFCETAKKMRGLGIALILLGTALLAGAAVGIMIFHARQGLVSLPYHYLILSLIGATGAALAILNIYHGIKLQFKAYDNDPAYIKERKQIGLKKFQDEFRKWLSPQFKLDKAMEVCPNYAEFIGIGDLNELLKEVIFSNPCGNAPDTLVQDVEKIRVKLGKEDYEIVRSDTGPGKFCIQLRPKKSSK